MAVITRAGQAAGQNTGTTALPITNPAGAGVGDKMLLAVTFPTTGITITDPDGWTIVTQATYNTRKTVILTRDYAAAYPNMVLSAASVAGYAIMALRAADGHTLTSFVAGSGWDRPSHGGSIATTTMPSVAGPADGLAIGISAETSTAAETEGQVTFAGAGWAKWFYADTDPASDVAANFWVGWKDVDEVASGDVVSTWPNASNNGWGIQVSLGQIPSGASPTGNLDTIGVYQSDTNSLTVGARLLTSGTVEAVLRRGGLEVARQEMSFTAGRGSATFTELTPATDFTITFEVDGGEQTDASASARTLRSGPASFVAVTGSCLFTGSTHPVFDRIVDDNPDFVTVQGDLHYADASDEAGWWAGMVASLNAMRGLPHRAVTRWTPDNHDTIRTDPLGGGAPAVPPVWKQLAGATGWASSDSVGQAWRNGRVLFIQTDQRSARDNYQTGAAPLRLLGDAQKAWFKDLLTAAESDETVAAIVWLPTWIGLLQGSGRWGSYPEEYAELNSHIQSLPKVRDRIIMVGGDSHNLWADSGARSWTEAAFPGIPSLNVSGFNRAADAEAFFVPDLANASLYTAGDGTTEADWGAYSRIAVADDGSELTLQWEAVRVNATGTSDVMTSWSKTFRASSPQPWDAVYVGSTLADAVFVGSSQVWPL
ncbi:hypothetical protein ACI7YT_12780 [Microbacterium sp. M]|uniref:hypothetical protein n=1 Tax=Microbacterium sp. M TaxID=3377125 RepID=UPI003870D43B